MTLKAVSSDDALFAAAALNEVATRLQARGKDDLAARARRVAEGLTQGGVIVAEGTA